MEGDIHCLLGWVGALARPSPAIFRNYRSVNPRITMTALQSAYDIRMAARQAGAEIARLPVRSSRTRGAAAR
jgi:hypothetical protein